MRNLKALTQRDHAQHAASHTSSTTESIAAASQRLVWNASGCFASDPMQMRRVCVSRARASAACCLMRFRSGPGALSARCSCSSSSSARKLHSSGSGVDPAHKGSINRCSDVTCSKVADVTRPMVSASIGFSSMLDSKTQQLSVQLHARVNGQKETMFAPITASQAATKDAAAASAPFVSPCALSTFCKSRVKGGGRS